MKSRPTFESEAIAAADRKKAYDESCKKILALKEIAARILAAVVEEFKDCSIDEIISCMGTPEIGSAPLDADTPVIPLDNSEDTTLTEGKRFFDIKFTVRVPVSGEYIHLIINLEAQKDFYPGYSLIRRGIYYCGRLISSQYGSVFIKSDYNKLRKVYSIWICTNPSAEYRNTVTRYSMSKSCVEGEVKFKDPKDAEKERRDYDLMSLVIIGLDDPESENMPKTGIIRMLSVLFAENMEFKAKITVLENEYDIKMTEEIEEEVEHMCNLSEGIWEKGINAGLEKGINIGIEKGINIGVEKGITIGKSEGIVEGLSYAVKAFMAKGDTFEEAVKNIGVKPDLVEKVRLFINSEKS